MITFESDAPPASYVFDVAVVAVGFERRCRWVTEKWGVRAACAIGLEFGFLAEKSYQENKAFFEGRSFNIINGIVGDVPAAIASAVNSAAKGNRPVTVFVDVSSMSREMIANVILGLERSNGAGSIQITISYAPSKYDGPYSSGPIRFASPIKPSLAGWSPRPEQPLGAIFGLGCESGLALGALQVLEPDKTWLFIPKGIDDKFDSDVLVANSHIHDIFDATFFEYEILKPSIARARFEALLNSLDGYFRVIAVPFGPKIFAWTTIATVVFGRKSEVGVWSFSSKEGADPIDREADGDVVWHNLHIATSPSLDSKVEHRA